MDWDSHTALGRSVCRAWFLLLISTTIAASQNKPLPRPKADSSLQSILQSGRLVDLRWPVFSDVRSQADAFYRGSGYSLAWVKQGKPSVRAVEMINILQHADEEGLLPEDYDASRWTDRLAHLNGPHSADEEFRFDVALTVCAMRYASAVRVGRINPKHFRFGLDVEHKRLDLPQFIRLIANGADDLKSEFTQIEPPFIGYKATREALAHYTELASKDDREKLPMPANTLFDTVFPGREYEGIPRLIRLLHLVGDLAADVTPDTNSYDGALVQAVERFQERHGIRPNGYLNKDTIDAMNVPLSTRAEQLRLALERYRWLRYNFSQPPVVVNLPEFRLRAFQKGGGVGLAMNVNVGDAYDFQTPVFENKILYVVFRPYWNVPPKILRNEVIPDIAENRDFVKDNAMEVTTLPGQVIASDTISDSVLGQLRAGTLGVRQKPGPENALRLLKVMFPNEHHVYLHDTPESSEMFALGKGALSHGCMHLEHPAELAAWLLRDKPGWNFDRVEQAMHAGRDNFTVNLTTPVPILIFYTTAVVEEAGDTHFFRDLYGHDATLEAALARGYPYPD